jgi:tRNA threonylcarbamoyl adenosine modification protein (Sua5/YciO/YrdC/YwlC family)
MSEIVDLTGGVTSAAIDRTLVSILQGEVVVVAAEHAYMYLCDAFNPTAVQRIHGLRGDKAGTAAQVMVGSVAAVSGLAKDFDTEWQQIAENFWPGLLTMQLAPQSALNWDLGDNRTLGEFALRIPSREFILALLKRSGPLAAASAAPAGSAPSRELNSVPALQSEIGVFIDEGVLPEGPISTVLRRSIIGTEGGIELFREGAITLESIQSIVPTVQPVSPH